MDTLDSKTNARKMKGDTYEKTSRSESENGFYINFKVPIYGVI